MNMAPVILQALEDMLSKLAAPSFDAPVKDDLTSFSADSVGRKRLCEHFADRARKLAETANRDDREVLILIAEAWDALRMGPRLSTGENQHRPFSHAASVCHRQPEKHSK